MPNVMIFKELGTPEVGSGGRPKVEYDYSFDSLRSNRKLSIKPISANYTVQARDSGKLLLVLAAATITLPTPPAGGSWDGVYVDVYNGAAAGAIIATQSVDTLVVGNDLTADSITYATAGEIIGASGRAFCYGSKWYWINNLALEAFTATVVT